jgi:protein MpaA
MERLGRNHGGYHGETIDIRAVLQDIEIAAKQQGWSVETFGQQGDFNLVAFHRAPLTTLDPPPSTRLYLSAGIHGDEPAGPLAALRLLQENRWPANAELWFCPCLNPIGFVLNRR